jgi:hypothetical protein
VPEAFPEDSCPARVSFNGDHSGADGQQMHGQSTGAGSDVQHQIARTYQAGPDQPGSPGVSELVVSPPRPPVGGHDAP